MNLQDAIELINSADNKEFRLQMKHNPWLAQKAADRINKEQEDGNQRNDN